MEIEKAFKTLNDRQNMLNTDVSGLIRRVMYLEEEKRKMDTRLLVVENSGTNKLKMINRENVGLD